MAATAPTHPVRSKSRYTADVPRTESHRGSCIRPKAGTLHSSPRVPLRTTLVIEVLDARTLRVRFNDGISRDVDCSFLFNGPLGEPLRDADYFRLASVDAEAGTVCWPNGLDPAPELLHGDYDANALKPEPGSTRAA